MHHYIALICLLFLSAVQGGSYGHNGAFGTIFWIDPEEGMIRIFLEQVFGSGNESDLFMAMAAVAASG